MIKISSFPCNGPSCPSLIKPFVNPGWLFRFPLILLNTLINKKEYSAPISVMYPFSLLLHLIRLSKLSHRRITELSGFHVFITLKLRAANANVSGLRACQSRQKNMLICFFSQQLIPVNTPLCLISFVI